MTHANALRPIRSLLPVLALSLAAGCALPTIEFGSPPSTDALAGLTPKASMDTDVLKALGEPQGRGILEHRPGVRGNVWFYYFSTNVGMDVKGKYLFVFLDGKVYDGYLWFSSDLGLKKQ